MTTEKEPIKYFWSFKMWEFMQNNARWITSKMQCKGTKTNLWFKLRERQRKWHIIWQFISININFKLNLSKPGSRAQAYFYCKRQKWHIQSIILLEITQRNRSSLRLLSVIEWINRIVYKNLWAWSFHLEDIARSKYNGSQNGCWFKKGIAFLSS